MSTALLGQTSSGSLHRWRSTRPRHDLVCPPVLQLQQQYQRKALRIVCLGTKQEEPKTQQRDEKTALTPSKADNEVGWRLFDLKAYNDGWNVPWGPGLVAGGMTLWMTSFLAVSFLVVPAAVKLYGGSLTDLTAQDRAYFTLATQTAETIVSLGLIRAITNSSSDKYDELKLFQYSFKAPFQKGSGWLAWGLFGALLSPVVVGGTAYLVSAAGYDNLFGGGRGTVDGVVSMINLDLPTYLSLLSVTGFQAPLLEETVFRGFLLTSLTKVMPTWAAVLASAVAFGIAHLSMRDLPVLVALGTWMGFMYVRSKNLLTPMLMHGTWNSFVLTLLFYLTSTGVDVEQLLNEFK